MTESDGIITLFKAKLTSLETHRTPVLFVIFVLALALRLAFVLVVDTHPDFLGGDTNWYMFTGHELVTTGTTAGPLQTPPLYLMFVGAVQVVVPGSPVDGAYYTFNEMQTARVLQSFMGAGLAVLAALIAWRLFDSSAGVLAGLVLAISPALIIESGTLLSEQTFLLVLFAGLWVYVRRAGGPSPGDLVFSGVIFGLGTLTRAALLGFPVLLALHLLLTRRDRWLRAALALLLPYMLVLSTWTVYNWLEWDRFVVGGEGLLSFLYMGAEGEDGPIDLDWDLEIPEENSHEVRQDRMRDGLEDSLRRDPAGWVLHRGHELVEAFLQPHNTVYLGGASIREAAFDWLREDRSLDGLRDVIGIERFLPKLLLYIFHYSGMLLGVWAALRGRRRWRTLWSLYAVLVYFVGLHFMLLAIPRYVFPTYPVLWIWGAALLAGSITQPEAASDDSSDDSAAGSAVPSLS